MERSETQCFLLTLKVPKGSGLLILLWCSLLFQSCSDFGHATPRVKNAELEAFVFDGVNNKTRVQGSLSFWNGVPIVVTGFGIEKVNLVRNKLEKIDLPIPGKIIQAAVTSDGRLMLSTHSAIDEELYIQDKDKWRKVNLPVEMKSKEGRFAFAGDGSKIYLASHDFLFVGDGNNWKKIPIEIQLRYGRRDPNLVLHNGKAYLLYNNGEWGGGLIEVDLNSKKQILIKKGNVSSICFDTTEEMWFSEGNSHILTIYGAIGKCKNGKSQIISSVQGYFDHNSHKDYYDVDKAINWKFNPTCFNSVLLDKHSEIVMAASNEGMFKYKKGSWERFGNPWPVGLGIQKVLLLPDGRFCLMIWESGVIIYDPETSKISIVKE